MQNWSTEITSKIPTHCVASRLCRLCHLCLCLKTIEKMELNGPRMRKLESSRPQAKLAKLYSDVLQALNEIDLSGFSAERTLISL